MCDLSVAVRYMYVRSVNRSQVHVSAICQWQLGICMCDLSVAVRYMYVRSVSGR